MTNKLLSFVKLVRQHYREAKIKLTPEIVKRMDDITDTELERLRAALAASGAEAAPSIDDIGMGDVAYHIAKRALDEKWDAAKLGPAIAKFVNDVWRERSAPAAASPEGEGREAAKPAVTADDARYWQLRAVHLELELIALRQSAAPSGPLDTPSKLSSSMASASGNAGVVMDAHRQIVKAEIAEARLDEALEIRKNFHGMAAGLTFGNLMDFVKWLDKHVSELEHAVAMTDEAPQQLQGESKTGAVTDARQTHQRPSVPRGSRQALGGRKDSGVVPVAPHDESAAGSSIPESGETGAVTETK